MPLGGGAFFVQQDYLPYCTKKDLTPKVFKNCSDLSRKGVLCLNTVEGGGGGQGFFCAARLLGLLPKKKPDPNGFLVWSNSMKVGITLRNMGAAAQRDIILECTTAADNSKLDSLWVADHLAL